MHQAQKLAVEQVGLKPEALKGRTAVVTGAGRGIGREIARAFARLGAQVVIAEISDEGRETERLIQQAGGMGLFVCTDVSNPQAVMDLVEQTRAAFGPADILINNAILCPAVSVLEMDVELWDRVIAVNLRGTFLNSKAFLPDMLARGGGVIVNMISTDAMPNLSAYIASKQGIAAFSQSLAGEVGQQGVRVIALAPGFVDTPGLREAAKGLSPQFGISEEEFMKLPIHPAYSEAAMPADHAAAATAYLVAVLADEYHGEQVTGYMILERAGFITPAGSEVPGGRLPALAVEAPLSSVDNLTQALEQAGHLQKALLETEAEFNKLPVFVRPMARGGFKSKSGQSLQDWSHTVDRLSGQLQEAATGNDTALQAVRAGHQRLKPLFEKLARYYEEAPAESARFIKDAAVMAEISQIAAERVTLIHALSEVLDSV